MISIYISSIFDCYKPVSLNGTEKEEISKLTIHTKFYYKSNLIGRRRRTKAGHFYLLFYLILRSENPS